jgi:antitoxin component HigA of HigAB toxin-antitoxin module
VTLYREYSDGEAAGLDECLRDLHAAVAAGRQLKILESEIAASRVTLIRALTGRFGWSQRDVAAELGVSQAAVSKTLRRKKKEKGEKDE